MKCNNCKNYEQLIALLFKATGYNNIYGDDFTMMARVAVQGLRKDMKLLRMYREAGDAALQAVDLVFTPDSCTGHFK